MSPKRKVTPRHVYDETFVPMCQRLGINPMPFDIWQMTADARGESERPATWRQK